MDNFCEQLVIENNKKPYKLFKFSFLFFIVVGILFLAINLFITIFFLILGVLSFFIKRKIFIEYEYIATNDQLDIELIYEEIRRKKGIAINIKDLEILARKNSNEFKDFSNKPKLIKKMYPKSTNFEIFCLVCTVKNERILIEFTPEEKIVQHCFKYNPRNVKR